MRKLLSAAAMLATVHVTAVHAQTATATGTGIAASRSQSAAQATAIGGGNATGGNAASAVTINSAAQPAVTSATQTVQGTQTVRNVPTVFAPGLSSAGLETCLGSASAGVGWIGMGLSGASTYEDKGCARRLDARTWWSFGFKAAAIARMCSGVDNYNSAPVECAKYLPQGPGVIDTPPPRPAYVGPGPIFGTTPAVVAYNPNGPPPVIMIATPDEQAEVDRFYVRHTPIDLIDGKTHKPRKCNDYDTTHHACLKWAKR
jgi:hypothetical protein